MNNIKISLLLISCLLISSGLKSQQRIFRYAKTGSDAVIEQSAVDSNGNNYVFGRYYTYLEYQGKQISSPIDDGENPGETYILKTSSNGKPVFLNSIHGVDTAFLAYSKKMAVNEKGEVAAYLTFYNQKSVNINGRIIPLNDTLTSALVVKFSKSGFLAWVNPLMSNVKYKSITPNDIKIDEMGNVYLAGYFNGEMADFGNGNTLSGDPTNNNMFLVKYSNDKTSDWTGSCSPENIDSVGGIMATHIELSEDGRVYVLGKNTGQRRFVFGSSTIQNKGIENGFISCFNNSGEPLWASQCESNTYSKPETISINNNGEIVWSCFFNSIQSTIQGNTITGESGEYNLAFAKFIDNGNLEWVEPLYPRLMFVSDSEPEVVSRIDDSSNIYLAVKIYNDPDYQMAFIKMKALDDIDWYQGSSSIESVYFKQAVFDMQHNLYFKGQTSNDAPFSLGSITIENDPDNLKKSADFFGKITADGEVEYIYNKTNTDTTNVSLSEIGVDKYSNVYVMGDYYGSSSELDQHPLGEDFADGIFTSQFNTTISVNGKVVNYRGEPIPEGQVKLIGYTYRQESPITDSVAINPDGSFMIENVPLGKYLLVANTEFEDESRYLPSYYLSAGHWADAEHLIATEPININNITLIMMPELEMAGSGFLSGSVSEVDESDIFKSTQQKPKGNGKATLAKSKKKSDYDIIQVTDIDEDGNFSFSSVDNGSYFVFIEIPGIPHEEIHALEVFEGEHISKIDYLVGEETITISNEPQVSFIESNIINSGIRLYPNPSQGNIIIEVAPDENIIALEVQNLQGKTIRTYSDATNTILINNLSSGIYFATITSTYGQEVIKFVITP